MASPSGIPQLGELAHGAHVGQLYRDRKDLLETLVPFFGAGLAQNERCVWVTAEPLRAAEARRALAARVPDLAAREQSGQIEIIDHDAWYVRSGTLGPDEVIASWLAAEETALRDGYSGLRVSGNTFWLEPGQWENFVDYEERVHAAFQDRKIVALCSYGLGKCSPDEVVDVLRNHTVSLVRADSGWQVVHGATAALASLEPDRIPSRRPHTVEFFRVEFPADRVADRLVRALDDGHAAFALASVANVESLVAAMLRRGVDVDARIAAHDLAVLDADAVFAEAWTHPGVDLDVIERRVLAPVREMLERHREVVAYGELVDLFARNADHDAALELERWWNVALERLPITLACGYTLDAFGAGGDVDAFRHVCDAHAAVGVDGTSGTEEADRLRVELAQVSAALAHEMSHRHAVETAYEAVLNGREQLIRLERLAAALGEVTTRSQLVTVVTELVALTLEADGIVIVEQGDAGERPLLLAHGVGGEALRRIAATTGERPLWSADAGVLGDDCDTLRSLAALPLRAGAVRVGSIALGYTTPRPFAANDRALVQDVLRQLALALDRSKTYEHLEHERERAELALRAKDEFLAMLGHELRNPLSPILTATQLMRLRSPEVHERERTVIERQVKHMIRLVDDLLDVSRITRGKIELRKRAVEIAEVIAQAAELASPALEERQHRFSLDVPKTGVVVHADPARLAQVFTNLLTNAAKYTPPGGEIRLSVQSGPSAVTVTVADNGIGIESSLLSNIFELFVQGRQGIDRAAGGLGLGLAISRSLCEMHGGSIRAQSGGAGKGSAFTVELPRYANTRPSARNNVSGGFAVPSTRARRVLVVDDNEDAAFLFSEALKRLGHDVDVAYDGPSALVCAQQRPPEIAFLDIGLPVMDGYELARRLAEIGEKPPRLIAVTGYGHSSDREKSRDAGFHLHLVKPIELTAVQDALAKLE
jgi:signal transduction histidine kinase/CheY-like chemotaxis protein